MGRPRSGKQPQKPLRYMTERHREMARRLVLGERQCDVAKALGISQPRLSDLARSPVFMAYMRKLSFQRETGTGDVVALVSDGAGRGLEVLVRSLTLGTPEYEETDLRTKIEIAQDLLDREGSVPRKLNRQQSY